MEDFIIKNLGMMGRLISWSKSSYRDKHPDNIVVFNANICVGLEKIWFGDIDVTLSKDKLIEISKEINDVVFVLSEMDGRFENENEPRINNYIVKFNPDGTYNIHDRLKKYYTL